MGPWRAWAHMLSFLYWSRAFDPRVFLEMLVFKVFGRKRRKIGEEKMWEPRRRLEGGAVGVLSWRVMCTTPPPGPREAYFYAGSQAATRNWA